MRLVSRRLINKLEHEVLLDKPDAVEALKESEINDDDHHNVDTTKGQGEQNDDDDEEEEGDSYVAST